MKNVLLTIVIPVYNTPISSLKRLFDSISKQSSKDFYVIIVDDGSDLKTYEFLRKIEKKSEVYKLVRQKNGGVSSARNLGIDLCKTDYISFVDADDYLDKDFVKHSLSFIELYNFPDIVVGEIRYINNGEIINTKEQSNKSVDYFCSQEELIEIRKSLLNAYPRKLKYCVLGSPCAKCYKLSIAKQSKFDETLDFYEDQVFNRVCFKIATSVLIIPEVWYYYIQNEFSAMHKNRNINFFGKISGYLELLYKMNLYEDADIKNSLRIQYLDFLYGVINYDYVNNNKKYFKERDNLKALMHNQYFSDIKKIPFSYLQQHIKVIDRLNILLLKVNMLGIVYAEKKIVRIVKDLRK